MIEYKLINEELAIKHSNEIKQYFKELLDHVNMPKTQEEIEELYYNMVKFIKDNTAYIVGAIENEKLLGFIWSYKREVNKEERYHVNYFFVNAQYRKQGIGKELMNRVIKNARENGAKAVELIVLADNKGAVEFYKKQEFINEKMYLVKGI